MGSLGGRAVQIRCTRVCVCVGGGLMSTLNPTPLTKTRLAVACQCLPLLRRITSACMFDHMSTLETSP
jgi:hypothetical protein